MLGLVIGIVAVFGLAAWYLHRHLAPSTSLSKAQRSMKSVLPLSFSLLWSTVISGKGVLVARLWWWPDFSFSQLTCLLSGLQGNRAGLFFQFLLWLLGLLLVALVTVGAYHGYIALRAWRSGAALPNFHSGTLQVQGNEHAPLLSPQNRPPSWQQSLSQTYASMVLFFIAPLLATMAEYFFDGPANPHDTVVSCPAPLRSAPWIGYSVALAVVAAVVFAAVCATLIAVSCTPRTRYPWSMLFQQDTEKFPRLTTFLWHLITILSAFLNVVADQVQFTYFFVLMAVVVVGWLLFVLHGKPYGGDGANLLAVDAGLCVLTIYLCAAVATNAADPHVVDVARGFVVTVAILLVFGFLVVGTGCHRKCGSQ